MKKILIISFTSLFSSRRVFRQIKHLKNQYEICTIGFEDSKEEGVRYYEVTPIFRSMSLPNKVLNALLFLFGRFEAAYDRIYDYRKVKDALRNEQFDLVIVHDLKPLPLLKRLSVQAPVLLDAHEYYFGRQSHTFLYKFLIDRLDKHLLQDYFRHQKFITTVGEWIAEQYRKKTNATIEVITSACEFHDLQPTPVDENNIRMIHHGLADPNRKIEMMIEMMNYTDKRYSLDIMLTTTFLEDAYVKKLKQFTASKENVRLIPPIEASELVTFTNQYDIGVHLFSESLPTHFYSLPNKFFEFIQARLCIAIGPAPEMTDIIERYDLGVVAENFQPATLAKKLNEMSAQQIFHHKQQCHLHAKELSSSRELQKLDTFIKNILPQT